ncbi:carboxylesterase family protein [Bifidobacterium pullorum subsp. saeculare]|uniref:Carboxylesterase family protein n=1 Tax=Bifidobacterium pullorum subsp. saeculare TaxID=78257 RepID=A0A939BAB6_9BIFI|nr:carboxylesterase family protein [Bifidobacterium pullorum]MBM6700354.1 carboxylesterase family protein [Bifidobacterium pullorum subsp. saeculare]
MLRTVQTALGRVEGTSEEDPAVTVFRGIPYAQPPVGELRWRAPRPVLPWEGTLRAHVFAPIAPQPMTPPGEFYGHEWQVDPATPQSEDCLYANVWTPALRAGGELTDKAADRLCRPRCAPATMRAGRHAHRPRCAPVAMCVYSILLIVP